MKILGWILGCTCFAILVVLATPLFWVIEFNDLVERTKEKARAIE